MKTLLTATIVLLLVACATQTKETPTLVWKDGERSPVTTRSGRSAAPAEAPQSTRTREPREGEVVAIPEDVMARLMAFVNEEKMLLADRIEIDASRIPFQVAMVPLADPSLVEVVELSAPKLKAMGLVMRSRAERPVVQGDYCQLRLGDGVDIVAAREIVARTYNEVDPDRPAFLKIEAIGHAVMKDLRTGERREGSRLVVVVEIVRENGRMVYRERRP